jgi:hypothetical protein
MFSWRLPGTAKLLITVRTASLDQFKNELAALDACVTRAGQALACRYTSSQEFEAEIIRLRRAEGAFNPPHLAWMRVVLAATAAASAALLLAMFL